MGAAWGRHRLGDCPNRCFPKSCKKGAAQRRGAGRALPRIMSLLFGRDDRFPLCYSSTLPRHPEVEMTPLVLLGVVAAFLVLLLVVNLARRGSSARQRLNSSDPQNPSIHLNRNNPANSSH